MSSFRQLMMKNKGGGTLNATVVGNPTISSDFIVSNFSIYNYMLLPEVFNPSDNTWEWVMKLKDGDVPSGKDSMAIIAPGTNTDFQGYLIEIRRIPTLNTVRLLLSSNGTNWSMGNQDSSFVIPVGTWYYLKTVFTGTQYVVYYSTDGENYQSIITIYTSSKIYVSSLPLAIGIHTKWKTDTIFIGEMDMKECYIKINNQIWWKGVI